MYQTFILGSLAIILAGALVARYQGERESDRISTRMRASGLLLQFELASRNFSERLISIDRENQLYLHIQIVGEASRNETRSEISLRANREYYELAALVKALNDTVNIAIGLMNADSYQETIDLLNKGNISVIFVNGKCGFGVSPSGAPFQDNGSQDVRIGRFASSSVLKEIDDRFANCVKAIQALRQFNKLVTAPPKTRPNRPANPSSRPPSKPPARPSTPILANYTVDWYAFGIDCDDLNTGGDR